MESKKIKVVLSTLYGTMGYSPGTGKEGNSIGFRPILTNATPGQIRALWCTTEPFAFLEVIKQPARKKLDSVYEMR